MKLQWTQFDTNQNILQTKSLCKNCAYNIGKIESLKNLEWELFGQPLICIRCFPFPSTQWLEVHLWKLNPKSLILPLSKYHIRIVQSPTKNDGWCTKVCMSMAKIVFYMLQIIDMEGMIHGHCFIGRRLVQYTWVHELEYSRVKEGKKKITVLNLNAQPSYPKITWMLYLVNGGASRVKSTIWQEVSAGEESQEEIGFMWMLRHRKRILRSIQNVSGQTKIAFATLDWWQ